MSLDRDELAARCLVAMLSNPNLVGSGKGVDDAVWWADALLAALSQSRIDRLGFDPDAPVTPADEAAQDEMFRGLVDAAKIGKAKRDAAALVPVAPASGAPATEPRRTVGAVVRWHDDEFIVAESGDGLHAQQALKGGGFGPPCFDDVFDRWATREECERHGIPYVARPLPGAPLAAPSRPATPAAWVPSVGDVVALTNDDVTGVPRPYHDLFGAHLYRVVKDHVGDDGCLECVRVDGSDTTSPCWISPGAMRPATSSERAAAGLPGDESATKPVDREGLARAIREADFATDIIARWPWEGLNAMQREVYFKRADAAVAFMAKGGA